MAKRPPNRHFEEYRERERQQRDVVIAEFDAGDTDVTLPAMAAKILRYRQLGDSACNACLRTLVPLVCWTAVSRRTSNADRMNAAKRPSSIYSALS
jgi:hypothetical protein